MSTSNEIDFEEQEEVYYETSDKCLQEEHHATESADDKNNDENPKSINDNNEQVNRINEGEARAHAAEVRQIMQMKRIDDKNDAGEKRDDKVMANLMSEHPLLDSTDPDSEENKGASVDKNKCGDYLKTEEELKANTCDQEWVPAERIASAEFSTKAKTYDSVSMYSNQDFSQISDCSDDDVSEIQNKLSRHVLQDGIGDNAGKSDSKVEPVKSVISMGNRRKSPIVTNAPNSRDGARDSQPRNRGNFDTTNARIHGDYPEMEKRGIRVLQPPGGFSSGLW